MNTIMGIFTTAALVICALILHELAHIFAVNYLGGKIEKIGAFPLGIKARFTGLEKLLAWERYVIYGAGSLANLIMAAWAFSVSRMSYFGVPWLEAFALYNIVLCVFNLIPVLPLDGGRIVHQFLSNRIGILRANRIMVRIGLGVGIALMFLGVVQVVLYNYNITLLCAGIYIKHQNKEMKPRLQMEFFKALEAKNAPARARLMPVKTVMIHKNASVKHAMDRLTMDHFVAFSIKERGYTLHERVLLEHIFANGLQGTVSQLFPCCLSNSQVVK